MAATTAVTIHIEAERYEAYRRNFGKGQLTRDVNQMVERKNKSHEKKAIEKTARRKK